MAIQVVPREASLGENFGKSLATGLGSQLASLGGQAVGAGASALGSGLGKLGQAMGIVEAPKKLTKEVLKKAGFSDADADIILAMPPQFQFKMMDAISQRAPAEEQAPEPTQQPQAGKVPEGQVSESFKRTYEEIKGVPFESTLPKEEGILKEQPSAQVAQPVVQKPSALFRKKKESPEEARLRLAKEKLTVTENAPKRKEINEEVKTWRKASKKADKDIEALDSLKTIPQKDFTPNFLRRAMTKAGFGDFFLTAPEETYKKIVEGLVIDKARDIASAGKITAALLDRIRVRYPALENTTEGRRILTNILGREAEEEKIYGRVYNELRKELKFEPGKEPLDILEIVEERAAKEVKAFKEIANKELEEDLGSKSAPEGKRVIINPKTGQRGYMNDNGKLVIL